MAELPSNGEEPPKEVSRIARNVVIREGIIFERTGRNTIEGGGFEYTLAPGRDGKGFKIVGVKQITSGRGLEGDSRDNRPEEKYWE